MRSQEQAGKCGSSSTRCGGHAHASRPSPRRAAGELGTGTVEMVLVAPVLIMAVFTIVQFGVYLHAAHVAEAAAHRGLRAAQGEYATAADGHSATTAFLDSTGGIVAPQVSASRGGSTATVTVTGAAPMVVPALDLQISSTAVGAVERFVPEPAR